MKQCRQTVVSLCLHATVAQVCRWDRQGPGFPVHTGALRMVPFSELRCPTLSLTVPPTVVQVRSSHSSLELVEQAAQHSRRVYTRLRCLCCAGCHRLRRREVLASLFANFLSDFMETDVGCLPVIYGLQPDAPALSLPAGISIWLSPGLRRELENVWILLEKPMRNSVVACKHGRESALSLRRNLANPRLRRSAAKEAERPPGRLPIR
mmetsp:Transcript_12917/g.31936  ORF Transcript_12917/g.31936 Transcript_12917/m.31936 type:complete len:208 (-) Transcript_12917:372-995(-)